MPFSFCLDVNGRRVMAKRSPHSFKKWEKENKRKRKAREKMAWRQGKKNENNSENNPEMTSAS
jgi:hypothetical protein